MCCGVCTACVSDVSTRRAVGTTRCTSDFDVEPGCKINVPTVISVSQCAIGFSRLVSWQFCKCSELCLPQHRLAVLALV